MTGRKFRLLDPRDGWMGCDRDEPVTHFRIGPKHYQWQEVWNGNPLRPPVGMRSDQASHYWIRKFCTTTNIPCGLGPWELEKRT